MKANTQASENMKTKKLSINDEDLKNFNSQTS